MCTHTELCTLQNYDSKNKFNIEQENCGEICPLSRDYVLLKTLSIKDVCERKILFPKVTKEKGYTFQTQEFWYKEGDRRISWETHTKKVELWSYDFFDT